MSSINVTIKRQGGLKKVFEIISDAPLQKYFDLFAEEDGGSIDSLDFMHNGECLDGMQTGDVAGIEDGDVIQVFQKQEGGAGIY